jgi:hypothetical protein
VGREGYAATDTDDAGAGLDPQAAADLSRASLTLARRFAAGATMWCLAPEWPDHGRHIAVEFVHPVIMGKPALPAVTVAGVDPIGSLRTTTRAGDVLIVVAPASSAVAAEAVRRAPAWGLVTIWIGCGPRPTAVLPDHLLWVDGPPRDTARHDGRLVLRYHVLWELTHVCIEHAGSHATPTDPAACDDDVCITCSDEGRVAEVAEVRAAGLVAVRTSRGVEIVDATLIGEVHEFDLVLVHAGTALERLDPHGG